jgi:hypothetical protein
MASLYQQRLLAAPNPFDTPAVVAQPQREYAEKLSAEFGGGGLAGRISFLPYIGDETGETAEMRRAYRAMLKDPVCKAAFETNVLAVSSLDFQVQPQNRKSPREQEGCDFIRHCVEHLPGGMPQVIRSLVAGTLLDGFGVCEKVFEIEDQHQKFRGKVVGKYLKDKDTTNLTLQGDQYRNVTHVLDNRTNTPYPARDFIVTQYMPIFQKPTGMSAFRSAYSSYWMYDTVIKLRAIHCERWASPFLLGKYEDPGDLPKLRDMLEQARARTWAAVPINTQIEAMSIAGGGEGDYRSFLDDCQKRILIAISGAYLQVLEGQVSDGRGSAAVSKSITELYQWQLVVMVQEALNRGWVPDLIDWNYEGMEYPRITLGGVNEYEQQGRLNLYAGVQQLNLPVSRAEVYENLGVQPPDPNEPDDAVYAAGYQPPQPAYDPALPDPFAQQDGYQNANQTAFDPNTQLEDPYAQEAAAYAERTDWMQGLRRILCPGGYESFSWKPLQRGQGRYWLPDGAPDTPEFRLYGREAEEAAARATRPTNGNGNGKHDVRADLGLRKPVGKAREEVERLAKLAAHRAGTPQDAADARKLFDNTTRMPGPIKTRVGDTYEAVTQAKSPGLVRRVLGGFGSWLSRLPGRAFRHVLGGLTDFGRDVWKAAKATGKAAGVWGGALLLATAVGAAPAYLLAGSTLPLAVKVLGGLAAGLGALGIIREGTFRAGRIMKRWLDPQSSVGGEGKGDKFRLPFFGRRQTT